MGKVLVIDAQVAGIAGDMTVGALLHLGANEKKIVTAMKAPSHFLSGCRAIDVTVDEVLKHGFNSKYVSVEVDEASDYRSAKELRVALNRSLTKLQIGKKAETFARKTLETIIEVEAVIHNEPKSTVHLHEAGSADTLTDIIGVAIAAEDLGLFENTVIYSTHVAVGSGVFKFSHGTVSNPGPAVVEIFRKHRFVMHGGPVASELTTPTGASILVNLAEKCVSSYPPLIPTRVGYGAGKKDFVGIPNLLKLVLGETPAFSMQDQVWMLETNIDDVSGEVIGHALNRLIDEGARDASVIPMFGKKNRPGYIVRVISDQGKADYLANVLMKETGSLGVRLQPIIRHIAARELKKIPVKVGRIKERIEFKISTDHEGKVINIKPEYEAARRLSEKTGIPLRQLMEEIIAEAKKFLREKV